jgi:hypothetical protein
MITGKSPGKRRGSCEWFAGATLHEGGFLTAILAPTFRLTETITSSAAGERVGPCHDNGIPMSRHQEAETRWLPVTSRRALSQSRQDRSFWLGWAISIVLWGNTVFASVRNNGMVALARELPLGPARWSCIYMVFAPYLTLSYVRNTHCTHITAIPLQLHPFIRLFRYRLSS